MKRILLYTLSSSLLLASTLVSAVDQTVTRTVTVDLGAESTINIGSTGTSQTATPTPAVNADGTKTLPTTDLNAVSFSATGAFACVTKVTSPNLVGTKFALTKEVATDVGESILYDLSTGLYIDAENGTSKQGVGTAISGSSLGGTTIAANAFVTLTDTDSFIGAEAKKSGTSAGSCLVSMNNLKAQNFKTSDTNSTSIPSTWKGKRTGVLTFTMTAL